MGTTQVAIIRMPFSWADGEARLSLVGVMTLRSHGSDLMLSALCEPWSACQVKTYLRAEETGTQKPVLP